MMKAEAKRQARQLDRLPPARLPFDVLASKLRVPAPRPGSVFRNALVNRLRAARGGGVVTLLAPAGYGKTTVLAQWAGRDDRPFVWLSLDERDDDPLVLLRHLAAALHEVEALPPDVLSALAEPDDSVWTSAVPRLTAVLESFQSRSVIVLDDVSRLRSSAAADVLMAVVDHLPEGWALVLSGRAAPSLPLATLRAEARLLEIGPELLALSHREAERLIRATGFELEAGAVELLLSRSEGWATGLYLGALALADAGGAELGGDDVYLREYFRTSCVAALEERALAFLRRTSVLDRMSGPLCDALLESKGSALELESLEQSGLFVIALDRRREEYRYHPLFRDFLRTELEEREPDAPTALNTRAADWLEATGDERGALARAAAAGDVERAARLMTGVGIAALDRGDVSSIDRWIALLPSGECDPYPVVSVVAALADAAAGRAESAERHLAAAEEHGGASPEVALAAAALCGRGPRAMLDDARLALGELPPDSPWRPRAHFLTGVAHRLLGDADAAGAAFDEAARTAELCVATALLTAALAENALLALRREEHAGAASLAFQARALADGSAEDATAILVHTATARVLLRQSRFDEARAELAAARELEPLLTHALPWLTVGARLELARAYLALRDTATAASLLEDAKSIHDLRPDLGVLESERARLEAEVQLAAEPQAEKVSGLTTAELRLLPLLATHLSFREIGDRLYLSRHTVKTQAISMYRKLGVSSRSDAIIIAAELGLLDRAA